MSHHFAKPNILKLAVAILLIAATLFSVAPAAHAVEGSGNCGEGLSWTLEGGVLTVFGNGNMENYRENKPAPWAQYADTIHSVIVKDGVQSVGDCAFMSLPKLTSVTLPASVRQIGDWAFFDCTALVLLDLGGVAEIGESAFENCKSLVTIRLPETLQVLHYRAFYRCESLVSITVPASVTTMEPAIFAYCYSLRNAVVLANVEELPLWTFYDCHALKNVSMTEHITSVGNDAFENCTELNTPTYDGKPGDVDISDTVTDGSVTTDHHYQQNSDVSINTQTTTTKTETTQQTTTKIDAVLESDNGWVEVENQVDDALLQGSQTPEVNVSLKGDAQVSGEDLGRFAGKDVDLVIHTSQGAVWHIDGSNLSANDLTGNYNLSFSLRALNEKNGQQQDAVGDATSFIVVFNGVIDFKVEVELPLGESYARSKAVFFAPAGKAYQRMQAVVIDMQGLAHFYLGYVTAGTEYLVGINVGTAEVPGDSYEDAIIPDTMQDMFPGLEHMKPLEYVITGQTSSWGMDIGQVTLILVIVLVVVVAGVGFTMFYMNKRRLKNGYVPETDDVEE